MKPDNAVRIPCPKKELFRYWLAFLKPFHGLTDRECDVAAAFLRKKYELDKVILDKELLRKTLMGEEMLREIREECNLSNQHFQVIKTKLKAKKFIVNGSINPRLEPHIREDGNSFLLLIWFDFQNAGNEGTSGESKQTAESPTESN